MKTIRANAEQVLRENYKAAREVDLKESYDFAFGEWVGYERYSDPDFYRWLFNDGDISDFGSNLTTEEMQTALAFIANI